MYFKLMWGHSPKYEIGAFNLLIQVCSSTTPACSFLSSFSSHFFINDVFLVYTLIIFLSWFFILRKSNYTYIGALILHPLSHLFYSKLLYFFFFNLIIMLLVIFLIIFNASKFLKKYTPLGFNLWDLKLVVFSVFCLHWCICFVWCNWYFLLICIVFRYYAVRFIFTHLTLPWLFRVLFNLFYI